MPWLEPIVETNEGPNLTLEHDFPGDRFKG